MCYVSVTTQFNGLLGDQILSELIKSYSTNVIHLYLSCKGKGIPHTADPCSVDGIGQRHYQERKDAGQKYIDDSFVEIGFRVWNCAP